ncbi:small ribosomal subunit protein eS10 [Neocloeon triangulifer]|uniref:small ribosomal subunit protein eS10 n=1 Tax=Neocloeon triangulifer TaxID=2078957 RepID=UPI00286F2C89|nr:small ribosomal subunit protein eS10 [Neocloeon triangulifer]
MLMPKKNKLAIYEYLFKEGVMVAKKDFHAPKHPELEAIPNLQVIKALQSLKSRGFVNEQFAWRHYYWYLNNEGINYLRTFLHLPPEIVPATLKRQTRTETARPRPSAPRSGDASKTAEDRAAYRKGTGAPDKKAEVGAGSAEIDFSRGFGRGRGAPPPQ